MNKFFNSLSFKIGVIIVLVEMLVLTALGFVYINRFSNQVDMQIETQAQLPGVLMNAGLLSFDSVSDPATMRELVGNELISGVVVGVNGNVFYALDPGLLGMDVADIPGVDAGLFDINNLQDVVIHDPERIIAVSPVYAVDQCTPRFFVYTEVSGLGATAEKTALTRLFIFGSLATMFLTSLVIIISFDQMISKRISSLVRILKRVQTGDSTARVQDPKSQDEIGFLQRGTNDMIEAHEQSEAQIIHLNLVLRAIRNVNQLIIRERDRDRLLKSACDTLTETRGYHNAWIALLDDSGELITTAEAGLGEVFLPLVEQLKRGELTDCGRRALKQSDVVITQDPLSTCADCPLSAGYGGREAMTSRLEHGEKVYGLMSVSIPADFTTTDEEEQSLFAEVAGDIAFALHGMEMEEERDRAEERARRLLERQVAVNQLALALGETRDLDMIYHTIYQHIEAMVDAWGFIVSSYDNKTQLIRAEYLMYRGTVLDVAEFPPIPLTEPGQGGQSQVIRTGESMYDPDHCKSRENGRPVYTVEEDGTIREGPPPEEDEDSPKSALYVPMKIEGKAIGVMQLQSRRLDAYSQEDIDLLTGMANVAAVAVQNARLYDAVQQELTRRKRAEVALKEYSERLEEMVEERTLELKGAQQELVRKEKLAILGRLAGRMAHELRHPMAVISNAVYFVRTIMPEAGDEIQEYLGIMSAESQRAERIISALLAYTHSRPPQPERVDVSSLFSQALGKHPPPENVRAATHVPPGLPPLFVDPAQIRQVLVSLLTNAYQAMTSVRARLSSAEASVEPPDGGGLTITAEFVEGGTVRNPKSQIRIGVSDTGCGISPENMDKLFEPLFTTKAWGIGLGLAVSRNLVEANGGRIEVESVEGKGSTFTVWLPANR